MTLAQSFDGFTGLSPPPLLSPSSEHPQLANFLDGDDLADAEEQDQFLLDEKPAPSNKKSNGRKGPGAADKRATHNAIERARRESLNGRFMTLAEALPSMAKVKRPSKSVIVQNALSFVYDAQVKEHALIRENNDLRRQVDQLRRQLGMAPLPPPAPLTGAGSGSASSMGGSDDGLSAGMGALEAHSPTNGTAGGMGAMAMGVSPTNSFPSPPSSEGQQHLSPSFAPSSAPGHQQAFGLFSNPPPTTSEPTTSPTASTTLVGSPFSDHGHHFGSAGANPSSSSTTTTSAGELERRHSFASVAPLPSPTPSYHHHHHQHAQAQAQAQAQLMLLQAQQAQAQFGYLNPALLSQAHLIAAQMQSQGLGFGPNLGAGGGGGQQGQGAQGAPGNVNPFDLYGMSGLGGSQQQQQQQQGGGGGGQQWGFVASEASQGGFGAFV